MARITVITAPPFWPNPGMASVDLAAHSVLRRLGLDADVQYLQLYSPSELHRHIGVTAPLRERLAARQQMPFSYGRLRDRLDAVEASHAVMFWGDFLHSRE